MVDALVLDLGTPVHVVDHGGDGPPVVLVHGLGGSAVNWIAVADRLAARGFHVVAPDLAGFGITPPGRRGTGVEANAGLVADLVAHLGEGPAALVGNSMGGLVSMLAATRSPTAVSALVLVDPALPVPSLKPPDPEVALKLLGPLVPALGAGAMRAYRATHSPETETAQTLAMCTADPGSVPSGAVAAMVETNRLRRTLDWSVPAFLDADRSIARWVFHRRRFRDLIHAVTQPTLVLHGADDRLVPLETARWAAGERPDWELVVFEGVGHLPMLEDPDRFVEVVSSWLG